MADFEIVRASRQQARARLALAGPSGAGKTYSAILVARGMVEAALEAGVLEGTMEGKIGVIDTERRSAQLYSHLCTFDAIELDPPYSVDRYLGALRQFERAGYYAVVIDQVTHAWSGPGGILELVDRAASGGGGGNSFNAWATGTPEYQRLVDGLLATRCHLICTMRQKTKWELVEKQNARGQMVKAPTRIGMAPEQRAGFEYEFTTVLGLDVQGHRARTLKDRTEVFPKDGEDPVKLDEGWGRRLFQWLQAGAPLQQDEAGTVLERLQATVSMGKRRLLAAQNMPDLERVYQACYREVRRFRNEMDEAQVVPYLDELSAAKDVEKARFPALSAKMAAAQAAGAAQRAEEDRVKKPAPNGAQALVEQEHARRHGTDLLSGNLADIKSDIPWND